MNYQVGDWVKKVKGYTYVGKVIAIYKKLDGADRVDVEVCYPTHWRYARNCEGMIHVFAASDLVKVDPNDFYA